MMKLKFDPSLAYQLDAVNAVADVFDGQPLGQTSFEVSSTMPSGVVLTTRGVGNNVVLTDEQILRQCPQAPGGAMTSSGSPCFKGGSFPSRWRPAPARPTFISARSSS